MFGLLIGDKHTYRDFNLIMTSFYIPLPEPKVSTVDVPFSDGTIDLTEVNGEVNYKDREGLRFEFVVKDEFWDDWETIKTQLAMFLHGKKLKMIPDNDIGFFYMVRLNVDAKKSFKTWGTIVLSGSAEAAKYDANQKEGGWLWDPFNFLTGVIRETGFIKVADGDTYVINGAGLPTVPEFHVSQSNNLSITANGRTYPIPKTGTFRFPSLRIANKDVTLTFHGSGELSVRYIGRYL